jgi:Nucleoside-diphosphate-sugar pyrophosphorylase involved in lipopolysaccharide biosynthesis/translation initiation factor 2B, gamma/epsilon subunits (eIF-2Bgamma/eIF-2Bepsilon)
MRVEGALSNIDVAVLAGGLGTRIRGVLGDTPKVLAPISGRPFLAHLLDYLAAYGARRVVLCLGHLADRVTTWLAQENVRGRLDVECRIEPHPLGTAGALGHARDAFRTNTILVMNGDTFLDADLNAFVAAHRASGAEMSILCVNVDDAARFGRVEIGSDSRIRRFVEKAPGRGTINAGVYLFSATFLDRMLTAGATSLECDVLEKAAPGTLHAHIADARFIDIGTPESLTAAPGIISGDRA